MYETAAFISYHHSDRIIAQILKSELNRLAGHGKGRAFLKLFLDVEDIKAGQQWKTVIDDNLSSKNWLIVLFTGEQSAYCGYEVGTFSQLHSDVDNRSIVTLHDVDPINLPGFLADNQNKSMPFINIGVDTEKVTLGADEVHFWFDSSAADFFKDFCTYKKLYTPDDEIDDPSKYILNIALAAKKLANAFVLARGTDVKAETPTQIGFELTIKGIGEAKIDSIPPNAIIVGTSLLFNTLGMGLPIDFAGGAPNTTWGRLKEILQTNGRRELTWLHKVETDVIRAINFLTVSQIETTFRGQNGRIYRPVMVRHQLYVNGDRKFYLLLLETLDRRFTGSRESSLLLTSLILASRWFFTYFEKWSETQNRMFGNEISDAQFWDSCRQLIYNIDWIEYEAAELGADDEQDLIYAFGLDRQARVQRFFKDWAESKEKVLMALPNLSSPMESRDRAIARSAILEFLTSVREQNADFLALALRAYAAEVRIEGFK